MGTLTLEYCDVALPDVLSKCLLCLLALLSPRREAAAERNGKVQQNNDLPPNGRALLVSRM